MAEVSLHGDDGRRLVRATVLALRRHAVDLPASRFAPADPLPPSRHQARDAPMWEPMGETVAFHKDAVEHRFVAGGGMLALGPATDWMRLRVPVVAGEAPSPLQRVVATADFVNGLSGVLPFDGWTFINPDLTVTLHRLPRGEWIGIDAVTRLDPDGVGTAEGELFDETGRLGRCVQTLLVEPR